MTPGADCRRRDGQPKRSYLTKRDAKIAARGSPSKYTAGAGQVVHAYRCPDCRLWHVGHDRLAEERDPQ